MGRMSAARAGRRARRRCLRCGTLARCDRAALYVPVARRSPCMYEGSQSVSEQSRMPGRSRKARNRALALRQLRPALAARYADHTGTCSGSLPSARRNLYMDSVCHGLGCTHAGLTVGCASSMARSVGGAVRPQRSAAGAAGRCRLPGLWDGSRRLLRLACFAIAPLHPQCEQQAPLAPMAAILIVGGTGYLGQFILRHFAASGLEVGPDRTAGQARRPPGAQLIDSSPPRRPQVGFTYHSCAEPERLTCSAVSAYKVGHPALPPPPPPPPPPARPQLACPSPSALPQCCASPMPACPQADLATGEGLDACLAALTAGGRRLVAVVNCAALSQVRAMAGALRAPGQLVDRRVWSAGGKPVRVAGSAAARGGRSAAALLASLHHPARRSPAAAGGVRGRPRRRRRRQRAHPAAGRAGGAQGGARLRPAAHTAVHRPGEPPGCCAAA